MHSLSLILIMDCSYGCKVGRWSSVYLDIMFSTACCEGSGLPSCHLAVALARAVGLWFRTSARDLPREVHGVRAALPETKYVSQLKNCCGDLGDTGTQALLYVLVRSIRSSPSQVQLVETPRKGSPIATILWERARDPTLDPVTWNPSCYSS